MTALTFTNALMNGRLGSVRIVGSSIAAIDVPAAAGDEVVDLRGERLLPGFINAHDHLQLNNIPALESRASYAHVTEWIADINARRRDDPRFEAQVAAARNARLLVGGVKNLLSGATTVAHHDPFYPFVSATDFPVNVPARYGWSHSLYIDGEERVARASAATPKDWPWIIHAAEGVNDVAASEFDRLEALGCVNSNTVIVHGVALDGMRRSRLEAAGAALIWCPSSNFRLFGKTADVAGLLERGHVALGTDSRLSGTRDLLDELRFAAEHLRIEESLLESMVTRHGARILRLGDRGSLRVGSRADLVILPAGARLSNVRRADVRLVIVGGEARCGDPDFSALLPGAARVSVDGRKKMLDRRIVAKLRQWNMREEGLVITRSRRRAA